MANGFMKKLGTSFLLVALMITSACTKSRDAKLSDDDAEGTFAIAELDISDKTDSGFSLKTSNAVRLLTHSESSKASNEKGLVTVDTDSLQVPERVRFMFRNLEVSGKAGQAYKIAFTVDNKAVTALKVVDSQEDLSLLERQLAISKEELNLQKKIQSNRDATKTQKLMKQLASIQKNRTGTLYVPIFKFEVKAYGIVEREKNSLGEATSKLRLKGTEWSQATHIKISVSADDRKMVSVDPSTKDELDRVFVANRINNKLTTVAQLNEQIDVGLNLDPATRILTLLDSGSMRVYEVTQISKAKLSDTQKEILRTKGENGEIAACTTAIINLLPLDAREGCIVIQRFNVPVSYVKAELPVIDYSGARASNVQFKEVTSDENTGLVKIVKNVMPEEVQSTGTMDPRRTLRLADIKDKEFFFRRTLEDVSAMGKLSGGMAGNIQLVKFVLQDNRIVVQKTVGAIDFRKTTNMENEEVMSLPVVYFKRQTKDASGNNLSVVKYVKANKSDAEYAALDWTDNRIPVLDSPLAFYAEATCFSNINNQQVVDTDMRLSEGILSFSYLYSTTMSPTYECLSFFSPTGDYDISGGLNTQFVQQVRERISFKVNDGSTDKAFAPTTPFTVQNTLNYGVFTKGVLLPSENGTFGREGSQINFPTVHDFRNGKKFLYTVGGMPENDPKRRALLKRVATEVIAEWNAALHKAFRETPLKRDGDYLEVQFAGEDGVVAHLGDLDKNLMWFVDRPMDNGLLGVSQVGLNPRSGVVVADSLIVYNGNNAGQLEYFKKYYTTLKEFKTGLEKYKVEELAKGEKEKSTEEAAALEAQKSSVAEGIGAPESQKLINQLKFAHNAKKASVDRFTPNFNLKQAGFKAPLNLNKAQLTAPKKKFGASQTAEGYIERIFKKAIEQNIGNDQAALESLTAKEILATYGGKMTLQQKNLLQQKAALMDMHSRMDKFFKNNPGCALRANDVITDAMYNDYLKMDEDEAFVVSTKTTLAHEMGHSLGLTHNFIGSFDKANFAFEGETAKRNYSSIMDYINDSIQTYEGLGPYDVYAMRAAYTGLLEIRPEARSQKALAEAGFKGKLISGRFIDINDVKTNDAKSGWANFTGGAAKKLIMPFEYCTDKDVGYTPTCQRFDFGTTPTEIVKNEIKEYEDRYIVGRYAGDRLSFNWANKSSVISGAIMNMLTMRQYLDEAFYRAIKGIDEDGLDSEHFNASMEAYKFLLNVISTPDTDKHFMDYSRFEKVSYMSEQPDGTVTKVVDFIEARRQADVAMSSERLLSIGNDIDKVLALQVLTLKGIGYPKYDEMSLNISYVDLENYKGFLGDDGLSPITSVISGILTNKVQGRIMKDSGVAVSKNEVTITPLLTSYAGITAIFGLESTAIDERDNYATLFKVGSSLGDKAPKDRLALSPLGTVNSSQARISFWALDNAKVANMILEDAGKKYLFIDLGEKLTANSAKMLKAQTALVVAGLAKDPVTEDAATKEKAAAKAGLLRSLIAANKDGQIASPEEITSNPAYALEQQVDTIEAMNVGLVSLTQSLIDANTLERNAKTPEEIAKAKEAADKVNAVAGLLIEWFGQITEVLPVIGSAQKAALNGFALAIQQREAELKGTDPALDPQLRLLKITANIAKSVYRGHQKSEADYGLVVRNLNFLNQLTIMTNPEYNR